MSAVPAALARFVTAWLEAERRRSDDWPVQPFDPAWPSPCQLGHPDARGLIRWRPVPREQPPDWSGLEHALEVPVHEDLRAWYGAWWSDALEALVPARLLPGAADAPLAVHLVQVWNESDFERLLANLIGHALQLRRRNRPLTLFVAALADDDGLLSVHNESGQVLLESPSQGAPVQLAQDLATFVDMLEADPGSLRRGS